MQLNLLTTLPWSLLVGGLFVRLLSQKLVKKGKKLQNWSISTHLAAPMEQNKLSMKVA